MNKSASTTKNRRTQEKDWLLDAVPVPSFMNDREGRTTHWNGDGEEESRMSSSKIGLSPNARCC